MNFSSTLNDRRSMPIFLSRCQTTGQSCHIEATSKLFNSSISSKSDSAQKFMVINPVKSFIFRDMMTCTLVKFNWRFGTSKKPTWSRQQSSCLLSASWWFLAFLHLGHENGGNMFLRNVGWISPDYTALYPRRQLFIDTAVRTLNTPSIPWSSRLIS